MFLLITLSNNSQCSLDANSNIMRFPVATKGSWTAAGIFDHFSVGLFGSSRFLSSLQRGVLPSGIISLVQPTTLNEIDTSELCKVFESCD